MATCGRRLCFHGAYGTREKAEKKAKRRGGSVISRKIGRQTRFVVVTPK